MLVCFRQCCTKGALLVAQLEASLIVCRQSCCVCVCAQAAAAASVAGVGLGIMPLTSLALGIDPGFLSLAGTADSAAGRTIPLAGMSTCGQGLVTHIAR